MSLSMSKSCVAVLALLAAVPSLSFAQAPAAAPAQMVAPQVDRRVADQRSQEGQPQPVDVPRKNEHSDESSKA